MAATLAAGLLVLLLAGGLGVLGGRPAPSPTVPAFAAVSPAPTVEPAVEFGPRVTPAVPCLRADTVPELQLEADGRAFAGAIEIIHRDEAGPVPTPALVPLPVVPSAPATIELRSDVVTLIRTIGDVCATSWRFDLSNPDESIGLESFMSPEADPEWTRQNQFTLELEAFRGRDFDLSGLLTFPGLTVQASWPIRILPFDAPTPRLSLSKTDIDIEPGCDLQLIFATGFAELVNPCETDMGRQPEATKISAPDSFLNMRFPVGWFLFGATVACGSIAEGHFQPVEGCEVDTRDEGTALAISMPSLDGTWSLAISGCATQLLSDTTNKACGTWYATLEVRRLSR